MKLRVRDRPLRVRAGHAPAGACGLKHLARVVVGVLARGHAPAGACGLKLDSLAETAAVSGVTPPRGRVD